MARGFLAFVFVAAIGAVAEGREPAEEYTLVVEPTEWVSFPFLTALGAARNAGTALRALDQGFTQVEGSAVGLGAFSRPLRAAFLDLPAALMISWTQHEVFGHSARCTELLGVSCAYRVALPPPFGWNQGDNVTSYPTNVPADTRLVINVSGFAAEQLLADEVVAEALRANRWRNATSLLILATSLESLWGAARNNPGSDTGGYDALLPQVFAYASWGDHVQHARLAGALFVLADPYLWISIYDYVWRWLIQGSDERSLFTLELSDWRLLLRPRAQQTPVGTQFGLLALGSRASSLASAEILVGPAPTGGSLFGTGTVPLWSSASFDVSATVAAWSFPSRFDRQRVLGGGIEVDVFWWVGKTLGITSRVGFKTFGYWRGHSLTDAPILQVGLSYRP